MVGFDEHFVRFSVISVKINRKKYCYKCDYEKKTVFSWGISSLTDY